MNTVCVLLSAAALSGVSYGLGPFPFGDRPTRTKQSVTNAGTGTSSSYGPPPCVAGTPQFPNYIQPTKTEPKRMLGKWYNFLIWYNGMLDLGYSNSVDYNTNLLNDSLTLYPGSNTPAVAFEQVGSYSDPTNNQCSNATTGIFGIYYLTADGQIRGVARQGALPNGLTYLDNWLLLSTDYDSYAFYYQCLSYDVSTGICAVPQVFVQTRDRPDLVSSNSLDYIASVVNQILGPYCFSFDLMKRVAWISEVGECPIIRFSDDCYKSLRDAYLYLGDPKVPIVFRDGAGTSGPPTR